MKFELYQSVSNHLIAHSTWLTPRLIVGNKSMSEPWDGTSGGALKGAPGAAASSWRWRMLPAGHEDLHHSAGKCQVTYGSDVVRKSRNLSLQHVSRHTLDRKNFVAHYTGLQYRAGPQVW